MAEAASRTGDTALLRAALEWSDALLTESERAVLWRLSVFAGGWTMAAAEGAPCATAPNPVSQLALGGTPVNGERSYRVAVSSLSAGGFNSFGALAGGADRADGPADTAAMETHLAPSLSGEPRVPPATDRIARVP